MVFNSARQLQALAREAKLRAPLDEARRAEERAALAEGLPWVRGAAREAAGAAVDRAGGAPAEKAVGADAAQPSPKRARVVVTHSAAAESGKAAAARAKLLQLAAGGGNVRAAFVERHYASLCADAEGRARRCAAAVDRANGGEGDDGTPSAPDAAAHRARYRRHWARFRARVSASDAAVMTASGTIANTSAAGEDGSLLGATAADPIIAVALADADRGSLTVN